MESGEEGGVGGFVEGDEWGVAVVIGEGDLPAEEIVEDFGESDGISGGDGAWGKVFGDADESLGVLFAKGGWYCGRGWVKGNDFQAEIRPTVWGEMEEGEWIDRGREFEEEGLGEGVG